MVPLFCLAVQMIARNYVGKETVVQGLFPAGFAAISGKCTRLPERVSFMVLGRAQLHQLREKPFRSKSRALSG